MNAAPFTHLQILQASWRRLRIPTDASRRNYKASNEQSKNLLMHRFQTAFSKRLMIRISSIIAFIPFVIIPVTFVISIPISKYTIPIVRSKKILSSSLQILHILMAQNLNLISTVEEFLNTCPYIILPLIH